LGKQTHLVRRDACTQHRPDYGRINIIRQNRQIVRIKRDVFLETAVLMVQMVRALHAVLLCSSKTELASATDTTRESDAHQPADVQIRATAWTQGDDAADTFVAADVGEFDLRDGVAVWAGCGAVFGVEV
jgi:hypothetical protein